MDQHPHDIRPQPTVGGDVSQPTPVVTPSVAPEMTAEQPSLPPQPIHVGGGGDPVSITPQAPVTPVASSEPAAAAPGVVPMPVVNVLSPRGVEYVFLTINLFAGAAALAGALIALVNGKVDFEVLAFPTAVLVVSVPLFALLFLRLKKAELRDPSLKLDASKRRSTQFTQIFSYLVVFFSLIGWISALFAKLGGKFNGSLVKTSLDMVVLVVVAGGILAYYWWDEHRGN